MKLAGKEINYTILILVSLDLNILSTAFKRSKNTQMLCSFNKHMCFPLLIFHEARKCCNSAKIISCCCESMDPMYPSLLSL